MEIEEPRVSAALNIRRMKESSSSSRACAARRSPSQMKSQAGRQLLLYQKEIAWCHVPRTPIKMNKFFFLLN